MRNALQIRHEMTLEDIRNKAPSAFATEPFSGVSEHYKFIPTSTVIEKLISNGFTPVMAAECKTRFNSGKKGYTKHIMRFRHNTALFSGAEVPELVLTNSHDRTSGYVLEAGIFRMVCSNGLVVCSESFERISVRHMGQHNLIDDVLEGSFKIIENLPTIMQQIEQWKGKTLSQDAQYAFAKDAASLSKSLEISPNQLLQARRFEDKKDDLYTTFNRVQENLITGGVVGLSDNGKYRRTRAITAITADTQINRDLWKLTEQYAKAA